LILRRRPAAATEKAPAGCLILRARGSATSKGATAGWLSSSIASAEETGACVLAWCCAWLGAKQ